MTIRVRLDEGEDVREFVFDRGEISIGGGAFNDIVLRDPAAAEQHGDLEVDGESQLRFFSAASGVPTSVIREEVCISTVGGDEESELELRIGDTLRFEGEPATELTIVEYTSDQRETFERHELSEVGSLRPGAETSELLWRATEAISREEPLEGFLRAVAAIFDEIVETRPEQLTLWFFADEGEVEDHIYRLEVPEEASAGEALFPGTYESQRAPLLGLGIDRAEVVEVLADGSEIVVRRPNPERASLCVPVGPDSFRGVVEIDFDRLSERGPLERISVAGSFVQPLGRIVLKSLSNEIERRSRSEENRYFRQRQRRHYLFKDLICESESMRDVYQQVNDWVALESPVLVEGEAGSGKSLLARALHHLGPRSDGMFISLDCRELTDDVLDSELFGCVESELVGAVAPRKGVFELADEGTVFVEEIDLLSPMLQGKLLRVLKEGEVRRIGDAIGRPVSARFVASTHRDLGALVERGAFRRDLYLLLQEHVLEVPPLRQRTEDILPLARTYLRRFADRYDRPCSDFSEAVVERLESHEWLGNARELKAVVESAVLKTDGEARIQPVHLAL